MKVMNRNMSPRDRIVKRLVQLGVPLKQHNQTPLCLVNFIKDNRLLIPELVSSILPTDKDVARIGLLRGTKLKEYYDESLLWMQWMMFGCDPQECLKDMERKSAGQRAVCGALWGYNNLVYRCRTCEHNPTCAICVSCFENGNHKDHDYSVMHSASDGCCDCGDETAWKREGFCTNHKGANHMQPLSEELASSVGPILDTLLQHWQDKVVSARDSVSLRATDVEKVASMLSSAVVDMLLDFCNCSDGLLSFASRRILECSGLLDVLIKAEKFLCTLQVKNKLHELFLKLLGVPLFKDEFAKVFVEYYPVVVNEEIKDCSSPFYEIYPLLLHCSVKIFTVPILTLRLVREMDLLGVLLGCLMDFFLFCVGEDGHLQVNKLINIYEAVIQLVEDVRHAMSHDEVHLYIARERPDISRAWLWLLSLVQGMDPQKRAIGTDTEDYDDYLSTPFGLCHYLRGVHDVLVGGAFSVPSLEGMKGHMNEVYFNGGNQPTFPASASWLISECLKAIESSLIPGSALRSKSFPLGTLKSNGPDILPLRKKLRGGTSNDNEISRLWMDVDENQVFTSPKRLVSSPSVSGEKSLGQQIDVSDIYDMNPEFFSKCTMLDDSPEQSGLEEALKMLKLTDWPEIEYDVSSQEISFHIPLHKLLSLLFRKALTVCYGETGTLEKASGILLSSQPPDFFGELLNGVNPCGFSAYVMENPLRLRVFCAQARAGMWFKNGDSVMESRGTSHRLSSEKKNGDSARLLSEWYHTSQWVEPGVDLDLFLLQCCAALAPPELFVKRIQERFGLTDYTSLSLADHNEYEPVLVQEMLTLIIQIVSERRFCGLSTGQNLHRELVCKLAVMDATQKQLVKALPDDISTSNQLQNILTTIAIYSKPSGVKEGKYSLRKESYRDLDLYHPRWNSRTLKTAEERYFCFYKGSASDVQLPRWTQIFEPLSTLSRIATSNSLLQIVRAVTFYAVFTDTSSVSHAPDGVIVTALHLLWLALDICETQLLGDKQSCRGTSFPILAYATEEIDVGFSYEGLSKNQSLLSMLVLLMRKQKEENHYSYAEKGQCNVAALIKKVLKKFAQLSSTCMDTLKSWQPDVI